MPISTSLYTTCDSCGQEFRCDTLPTGGNHQLELLIHHGWSIEADTYPPPDILRVKTYCYACTTKTLISLIHSED